MRPILSFIAALVLLGAAFSFIHFVSLWLSLPDLAALLLFAIPVVAYIAYTSFDSRAEMLRAAATYYLCFAAVVLAAAGLVYFIDGCGS